MSMAMAVVVAAIHRMQNGGEDEEEEEKGLSDVSKSREGSELRTAEN